MSVVSRINTGIKNPAIGQSDLYPTSGSKAARAGASFMRGVKELQYRFLNATNWKCKTAPPRGNSGSAEFREQDFLRKLSKGKMDSLDTMLGLVRLTEVNPNAFSELKVSRHQAQRMLDNLEAHGELFSVLQAHIKSSYSDRINHGPQHLKFLKQLNGNFERLAEQLMDRARYRGETLAVDVDDRRQSQLDWVVNNTWIPLHQSVTAAPGKIFQQELLRAKDKRRELSGTKAQKDFALDLKEAREVFKVYNAIPPESLRNMLTGALRKVGVDAPDQIVQKNVDWLTKAPRHSQAKLLPPLLEAMSDVIDGVGSARYDLKRALDDIKKAGRQTDDHIMRLNELAVSIAMGRPANDEQFVERAKEHLRSRPQTEQVSFLTLVDVKSTSSASPLIQKALRSLADETVLDLIAEFYTDFGQHEDPDALVSKIDTLSDDSLLVIADFFDRNPWVASSFKEAAAGKVEGPLLSSLIAGFDDLAHVNFEREKPTSLSPQQEQDRKIYLRKVEETGDAWKALCSFIGDDIAGSPHGGGDE